MNFIKKNLGAVITNVQSFYACACLIFRTLELRGTKYDHTESILAGIYQVH